MSKHKKINSTPPLGLVFLLVLLTSLVSVATFATELYQWVDEEGVTHFSQNPPSHMPALQAVDVHGIPVISGNDQTNTTPLVVSNDAEETTTELEVEKVENPEKDPTKCAQARQNISQMETYARIRTEDAGTGELRYLTEEEKTTQLKNWRDRESTYC